MDAQLTAAVERRRFAERYLGLEDFNYPYSHRITELTGGSPPDLVLCHNLHGGYFDLRALAGLTSRVPVALRLFDTWLLAGHCAYALGCPRWQTGCGRCPDLAIPPAIRRDATGINWWRKRHILGGLRLFVTAESQWMLDRAKKSLLAPAVVDWKHIPGGVDLDVFYTGPREAARRELGLAADANILLYVANQGSENRFKDFDVVRRALCELARRGINRQIQLLVVGATGADEEIAPGIVVRHLGYVASPTRLAAFYRAADIYVHAAIEEAFGNTVAEALACGVPTVAASGGGVLELLEHERTGLVVPPRRPIELAGTLARLLDAPERAALMGAAAAAVARRRLDVRTAMRNLYSWCVEVQSAWHAAAAG